jgi:methanethiol S-methyltransferase
MKLLFVTVLWIAYCALHSYLISIRFTNLMTRLLGKYYIFYRAFYVVVSIVLFIPLIQYSGQIDHDIIIHDTPALTIVRYALTAGSLLLFFWVFFVDYDSLSFFGIRQILNGNRKQESGLKGEIKKNGILGIMRHPMYFALIIFIWCQTHRLTDIFVNIVFTVYVFIGTWLEERKLVLEFGEAYLQYKKEVPMIIPFTKFKSK